MAHEVTKKKEKRSWSWQLKFSPERLPTSQPSSSWMPIPAPKTPKKTQSQPLKHKPQQAPPLPTGALERFVGWQSAIRQGRRSRRRSHRIQTSSSPRTS